MEETFKFMRKFC